MESPRTKYDFKYLKIRKSLQQEPKTVYLIRTSFIYRQIKKKKIKSLYVLQVSLLTHDR